MSSKQELREEAQTRRTKLAAGRPQFAALVAGFGNELGIAAGAAVAGYWPVRGEADPRGLMRRLAESGHAVALPWVAERNAPLLFRRWQEGDDLVRNAHGVCEAKADVAEVVPETVLVPLLAFDAWGFRLGYGGGYYDRTLALLRGRGNVCAIGVAYAGQEIDALPREAHDHRLDAVLTEQGIRWFEG